MIEGVAARPLVGREAVLEAVLSSVLRPGGQGAVVVADAGLGKSALAGAVAAEAEGRIRVHRIHTSSSLSRVPYGALAPLLPDLDPRDTDSPLAVMRSLLQRLFPGDDVDPAAAPLLIIDDADALDEAGADLLAQLVASARIRVVLLARRIADIPAGLAGLVWEGALSRHELLPLTEDQVKDLCVQVLGGPVLTSTSTDLARVSGGNPMLVLALLSETVRMGSLVLRNEVWLLQDQMLPPEGRLGDLLRAQLAGLSKEEHEALEIIALAEPLPAATAFELGLHRAVDSLTEAKLVKISAGRGRLLRPMHPVYGEVVRRLVPAARSARLRQRLLTVTDPSERESDNLLRWVCWSLDCGAEVSDADLVAAAYRANNVFDSPAALRTAGAVKGPDHALAARVQAARACFQDGHLDSARELVDGVTAVASDLTTLKMAVLIRVQVHLYNHGDPSGLAAIAAEWLAGVDRIERSADSETADAELIADISSSRRGGRLLALKGRVTAGSFHPAEAELEEILADARRAGDDEAILVAEALLAEILIATGRARAAGILSRDAMVILDRGGHRFLSYSLFVLHRHVDVLLWLGEWEELHATLRQGVSGIFGALVHVGGTADLGLAVLNLRNDDSAAALTHLSAAIEGLRTHDSEGMLPIALGLGALIAAGEGRAAAAEGLLAEIKVLSRRGAAASWLLAHGYAAAARSVMSGEQGPPKELGELAAEAEHAGFVAAELELRTLALSFGDLDGMSRLRKISEEFEGPQAEVIGRFARAVLDEDAEELLRLGSDPVEPGWERLAKRCTEEALRLARAGGDRALLKRVQRELNKKNGLPARQKQKAGVPLLTRREHDVAALVMQGCRNAEIAERLFLSVRTVEGHIYRTFEKLGISRREDLKPELLARNSED
ncbi:LuxR C-terminal-related transcriptional regulator [Arthrobacter sp. zg-Y1219]|uniref:LuxR C-terminal-related transcriptional regulator n=1 Tax=Arthrobacter sp. zg-Y1219 TaxID=3049067 RepID=UPI0024C45690|nr:LuxR C-terminal-related transcriptional regulator [Arthrobacter sp. zg-Y1219]MDK1360157.1 LuxR C-terminal-related transcriptional regulator [Arthrobacter sp. zg-Y1219]